MNFLLDTKILGNGCFEGIGRGRGQGNRDRAGPFSSAVLLRNRDLAPDCMGAWLVYWRQNMPGMNNRSKDDAGKPMKNWWPFLFY